MDSIFNDPTFWEQIDKATNECLGVKNVENDMPSFELFRSCDPENFHSPPVVFKKTEEVLYDSDLEVDDFVASQNLSKIVGDICEDADVPYENVTEEAARSFLHSDVSHDKVSEDGGNIASHSDVKKVEG